MWSTERFCESVDIYGIQYYKKKKQFWKLWIFFVYCRVFRMKYHTFLVSVLWLITEADCYIYSWLTKSYIKLCASIILKLMTNIRDFITKRGDMLSKILMKLKMSQHSYLRLYCIFLNWNKEKEQNHEPNYWIDSKLIF